MTWTVSNVLQWTAEYFKKLRIPTSRLDAEVLLAHLLKTDRVGVYTHYDRPLNIDERRKFREMVKRRAKYEPVAYITGYREFFSLNFLVQPGVLIPRSDTEILVEKALELRGRLQAKEISLLDLGTGCGNIAISLANRIPGGKITATDISHDAICIAGNNARRLGAGAIEFLQGNLLDPVQGRQFDMIVSNPPYISWKELKTLQVDIRNFEPRPALDGGNDGLDFYRRIINKSGEFLKSGGLLLLEIGAYQKEAVKEIFHACAAVGYRQTQKDYSGHDRVIVGQKD